MTNIKLQWRLTKWGWMPFYDDGNGIFTLCDKWYTKTTINRIVSLHRLNKRAGYSNEHTTMRYY